MAKPKSAKPQANIAFEEIEHTADWALRIQGQDLRQLLLNAARGMSSLLVADLADVPATREEQLEIEAYDAESLLVNWLSELAYRAEVEGIVFAEFDLSRVTPTHLQAAVRGGHVSDLQKHIKAVTYHNLEIIKTDRGLEATVVFDV
ncbi:MAG: archease [Anaerolineae bacterium]|nr:archease [Anaerolineae bacterium]